MALTLTQCKDKVAQDRYDLYWKHLSELAKSHIYNDVCILFARQVLMLAAQQATQDRDPFTDTFNIDKQSITETDLTEISK